MMAETCKSCGRYTEAGLREVREQSKTHPIYGTDFSKPVSEIIAGIRNDLTKARGQLSDVSYAYSGIGDRLASIEGLLTCGLVSLYYVIEEIKKHEAKYPKPALSAQGDGT